MSLSIASMSKVASEYSFNCNIVFLCFWILLLLLLLLLFGGVDRELSELWKNRLVGLLVLIYREESPLVSPLQGTSYFPFPLPSPPLTHTSILPRSPDNSLVFGGERHYEPELQACQIRTSQTGIVH